MKKYFKIFAGILATAFIATGCQSYAQTGYSDGYYNPTYGYNYSNGYGDGQPGNDYYYNNQQPDPNSAAYQQQPNGQMPMGFNDFYNQLSPYGAWVNMAPYGPVWVANVPNFQPYSTNGYWAYTNYGWTWVSNYSWGWAPFHYGRWGFNNRYGWYWVPGYEWGPAWVAWSSGADMYGWAPLMPGMNFGVSLSINLFPSSYWTFMPGRYMGMNNIGGYYVDRSRNVTIIKNTTIINNYGTDQGNSRRYSMGPSANDVQRYTGRTVQQMRVTNASDNRSAGVSNNEMRVYRPVTRSANTSSSNNNRGGTMTSSFENNNSSNNRIAAPQTGTQPVQPQPQQPERRTDPQIRTQPAQPQQPESRADYPQTRAQPAQSQQSESRAAYPQTRTQPAAQQNVEERNYQQNPAQPRVTNNAAPQTSRQIQAAQSENRKVEQQRSAASSRTSTNRR